MNIGKYCLRHLLISLLIFLFTSVFADPRNTKIDSLIKVAANEKNDSLLSRTYWKISTLYFQMLNDDSTLYYASKGYEIAERNKNLGGMWINLAARCNVYIEHGNYQKTLGLFFDFLKLCEERNDLKQISRVTEFIAELYIKMEDYQQAVLYAKKNTANIIESKVGGAWLPSNYYTIGNAFIHLNQSDSALSYFQKGYAIANSLKIKNRGGGWVDQMLIGLGMANQQLGNKMIALAYYNQGIEFEKENKNDEVYYAYMQKASLLLELGQVDSSTYYYTQSLAIIGGNPTDRLNIYKALAKIYKEKDVKTSVQYFSLEQQLRDSLFASEKVKALQSLVFNEQERQKDLARAKLLDEEEHAKNIQNGLIAVSIIAFIILFLLLSRSVIVNEKWVQFLGVLGLLILFEFINLLIHPKLERLTDHSPVFMLIIMVGIAALLIPFHHKTEKWVTMKMIEKNKQVRLAAAKRTIEKLGG